MFVFSLHGQDGHIVFGHNTWGLGHGLPALSGAGEVAFTIPAVTLLEGQYPPGTFESPVAGNGDEPDAAATSPNGEPRA